MALVEEDAINDALNGLVDRSIVKDDVGCLAAKLERYFLVAAGNLLSNDLADLG